MSTSVESQNHGGVMSESARIIKAHSADFRALFALFLLPLSFSITTYPTQILLRLYASHHHPTLPSPALLLLYTLLIFSLAVSAVATITYTAYHGFSGSPVKLSSAIKSVLYSFIPLASTALASLIIQVMISLAFVLFLGLIVIIAEILGFDIDYKSNGFIGFCIILSIVLLVVLAVLQVNWALGCVIVVVESKWGFEPLWRSAYLVKGTRSVTTSLLFILGASFSMLVGGYSFWVETSVGVDGWKNWEFILLTVECTGAFAVFMIRYIVANTVVFVYCKAAHGELVVEEFAGEYVSLPMNDEKLPHVVQV